MVEPDPRPMKRRLLAEEDFPLSQGDNRSPWGSLLYQDSHHPEAPMPDINQSSLRRGKNLHDRIHDQITLPPLLVAVIDTPEFQRLRKLTQLGCTQYLFPGAMHTRFEHCIGVAHIAGKMIRHLRDAQPELDIDARDVLCVMFAGLVHDLGHGPFSHSFEQFVNLVRKSRAAAGGGPWTPWHHEDNSVSMLRVLVEDNGIDVARYGLDPGPDLRFVELLIHGLTPGSPWPEDIGRPPAKRFLFDIVANKRNGIDVDKLDYFLRDSTNCYGRPGVDCQIQRLITCARVIVADREPQICFEEKVALSLGDIFLLRAKMHKYVYQHHTVKVCEQMLLDAFTAAEGNLWLTGTGGRRVTLAESVDDPAAYRSLGDWILDYIEASADPALAESRRIIGLLRRRMLYPLVGYAQLRPDSHPMSGDTIAGAILALIPPEEGTAASDFAVSFVKITCGSSDSSGVADDPLCHVNFFNPKRDPDRAFKLPRRRVSSLFRPSCFEEHTLLVFARRPETVPALRQAWEQWKEQHEAIFCVDATSFNFSPSCSWASPHLRPAPPPITIAPAVLPSRRRLLSEMEPDDPAAAGAPS